MRASVTAGSAAHYHMHVASTVSGSPPRPDDLMRRTARWRENISRREAKEQQEAARRGSDAAAGRVAQRLGGAAAAERGQVKHETPPSELHMASWDWLDDVDEQFMHELDTLVSRTCLPEMRAEHQATLHFGFEYIAQHMGSAAELRGWKFNVLAKAVTTGRLRGEAARSLKEVRGRIRFVNEGHLQRLVEELFDDAKRLGDEAEALEAAQVAAATAEDEQAASPAGRQRARVGKEAAAAMAAGLERGGDAPGATSFEVGDMVRFVGVEQEEELGHGVGWWRPDGEIEPMVGTELNGEVGELTGWHEEDQRWVVQVNGVDGLIRVRDVRLQLVRARATSGNGARRRAAAQAAHASEACDVEKKLTNVLRLCAAGYLSKGYAQFGTSPLSDPSSEVVRRKLRSLHPQPGEISADGSRVRTPPVPTADEFPNKQDDNGRVVGAHVTTMDSFVDVFSKPPQERGLSLDAVSYEELSGTCTTAASATRGRCSPSSAASTRGGAAWATRRGATLRRRCTVSRCSWAS